MSPLPHIVKCYLIGALDLQSCFVLVTFMYSLRQLSQHIIHQTVKGYILSGYVSESELLFCL